MKHSIYIILIVLVLSACTESADVVHPETKDITQSVYASGVIVSKDQYQVFTTTSGILEQFLVSEGDTVRNGQAIATISNKQAILSGSNAALTAEFNALQNNAERLDELKMAVQTAALKRTDDSLLMARQRSLSKQGVGSQTELEQRTLIAANSRTAHENAVLRYQQMVKQLRFASKQASINRAISASTVNDLTVRSEVEGRVFAVLKKKGEAVNPQTPLAVIGSEDWFVIELQVDEYDIASIRVGQPAYITMDSYRDSAFHATITKVHPMMNARTKSFTVEAIFTESPSKLFANLTVEANIVLQTKKSALIIPRSYLTKDGYVKLKSGSLQKVVTGIMDYQMVEVLSGVTKNDALVKP